MTERKAGNWFEGFRFFTQHSEAPDSFLHWSAISCLSAAMGGRIVTTAMNPYTPTYPNIYALLVGPPGIGKGLALGFMRRFCKEAGLPLTPDGGSKEKLGDLMKKSAVEGINAMTVCSLEFSDFLGTSENSMVEFLTSIWDCQPDWNYATIGRGEDLLEQPYLTMAAGTTPKWMADNFSEDFMQGGFAARCNTIYATKKRFWKVATALSPEQKRMRDSLIADLITISQMSGDMQWTSEALEWYVHWYENVLPTEKFDFQQDTYGRRKGLHVIKLAMIVSISQGNTMRITLEHLQVAIGLIDNVIKDMGQVFAGVGENPLSGALMQFQKQLKAEGSMSMVEFTRRFSNQLNLKDQTEILKAVMKMGRAKFTEDRKGVMWAG